MPKEQTDANTGSLLAMRNVSKRFAGVKALDNVSFESRAGEVHALMGENGAGKSTLIKILSGAYAKDAGEIFVDGQKVNITKPKSAHDTGISVIYQELALIPHLTVAENIFIDQLTAGKTFVDWERIRTDSAKLIARLGFPDIDVMAKVSKLTIAYMQIVEIAKALSRDARIFVFDEPTAVLTDSETEKLFGIIRDLKSKGACVIYVSHRIKEIFEICDRITVLKDGKFVNCVNTSDVDEEKLVTMMVGRKASDMFPHREYTAGRVVLKVNELHSGAEVDGVSFEVRKGEILGVSGLVGAGRTETMQTVFGARKKDSGEVIIDGKTVDIRSPEQALRYGVGMAPEDRKNAGVILDMPIYQNGTMSVIGRITSALGWIRKKREMVLVTRLVEELTIKTASVVNAVSTLSGGNQQKVSLMKWLAAEGDILILDEPTRGVDVGAKAEIYGIIARLAQEGIAIIMVSSEMSEIIGLCDRVIVMRHGRVSGELGREELNEQKLLKLAMGVM
jgi:ribose transport system ATP-binding protein